MGGRPCLTRWIFWNVFSVPAPAVPMPNGPERQALQDGLHQGPIEPIGEGVLEGELRQ